MADPFAVYSLILLTLSLLVLRILADDHDRTLALDHFALFADRFYRRSYLHNTLPAALRAQNSLTSIALHFFKCKRFFLPRRLICRAR